MNKKQILDTLKQQLDSIDIDTGDIRVHVVTEYAGIKNGEVVSDWTTDESDIRAQSNYLDRMEKRTTLRFTGDASTAAEFVAGKRP